MHKQKIIFIAGTARSGSTLLDFIIGSKKETVSLGEIYYSYNKYKEYIEDDKVVMKNICSCGENGYNCSVWSEILNNWFTNKPKSYKDAYLIVLEVIQNLYGNQITIVDSSKYVKAMVHFDEISNVVDVIFLHTIKDVRSCLNSWVQRRKEKNETNNLYVYFKLFRRWYLSNKKIENYISKNNFKCLIVSYDAICLSTNKSFELIDNFIDSEHKGFSYKKFNNSHVYFGNPFRLNFENLVIKYDNRWFYKNEWHFPYLLMSRVRKLNKKYFHSFNTSQ